MRRELFALHLPNPDWVTADYALLEDLSHDLSGGDVLNVCLNAIYAERVQMRTGTVLGSVYLAIPPACFGAVPRHSLAR